MPRPGRRAIPDVPDAAGRRATALCYADERILAVGSDEEILALAGPDSVVVDLRGRAVLPGFVEPHAHPYWEGFVAGMALLAGRERRAALRAVPGATEHLDPDAWLVARYDPTGWDRPDDPTRDDLDRAVPDRPVLLAHVSGHAVTANSLALAVAGVDAATAGIPGQLLVELDASGEPTGILRGPDAWDRIAAAMPPPTAAEGHAALARAAARLAADGVTSVADADVGSTAGVAAEMAAWGDALQSGAMPLAVALLPGLARIAPTPGDAVPGPADLAALLPDDVRARVRLSHVKLKADGALTTRTAWLRERTRTLPTRAGRSTIPPRSRSASATPWPPGGPPPPTPSATPPSARSSTRTPRRPRHPACRTGSSTRCFSTTTWWPAWPRRASPPSSSRSSWPGPARPTAPDSARSGPDASSRSRASLRPASPPPSPATGPSSRAPRSTGSGRRCATIPPCPPRRRSTPGRRRAPPHSATTTRDTWRLAGAATS